MPRIPDYQQTGVVNEASPQMQQQTSAPLEAFGGGQALQGMEAATKLGGEVAEQFIEIKKQADLTKVMQANDLTVQAKNKVLYDPETGAMNLKGQSALGVSDAFGAKFKTDTDEIEAQLDNGEQRAMYQKLRAKEGTELQGLLEKHTFAETQAFQKEQIQSSLKTVLNDTTLNYSVNGKVQEGVAQARAIALHQADMDGIKDPEMRKERALEAGSAVHTGVLERMINTNDPKVQGYFLGIQDQMTAADRAKIEPSLKTTAISNESARKADDLIRQYPDLSSQMAAAREMEPGDLRDKVITRLKDFSTDQKMAIEADSNRRYSALSSIVERSGGYATLPTTELTKMSSDDRAKLEARMRQLREGVTAERASRNYYKYKTMAASEPGKFKSLNLDTIRGQVTAEELKEFINIKDDLISGKGSKALDQQRSAQTIANEGIKNLGFWHNSEEEVSKFNDEFFRRIDRAAEEKGKPLNDAEMTRVRDDMATKVIKEGFFWNSKVPSYQIEALKEGQASPDIARIEDVPAQTLRQIREAMSRNGIKYTDDQALLYANRAMRKTRGK